MQDSNSEASNWYDLAISVLEAARVSLLDNRSQDPELFKRELSRIAKLQELQLIQKCINQQELIPTFVLNDFTIELAKSAIAGRQAYLISLPEAGNVPNLSEIMATLKDGTAEFDRHYIYRTKSLLIQLVGKTISVHNEFVALLRDEDTLQPTVSEFEYSGEKIEATPVANQEVSQSSSNIRQSVIEAQIGEIDRLHDFLDSAQSVQIEQLCSILTDYQKYLLKLNFIRADVIFSGIRHNETKSLLFEVDRAWLDTITRTHDVLRSLFPEYDDYIMAVLKEKESQIVLKQAEHRLSKIVINSPPGTVLLAESVRSVVADIESQSDNDKAEWDSKGVAAKLDYVLKKLPEAAKAGSAADQLVTLIEKYLNM